MVIFLGHGDKRDKLRVNARHGYTRPTTHPTAIDAATASDAVPTKKPDTEKYLVFAPCAHGD